MVETATDLGAREIMQAVVKVGEAAGPGFIGEQPNIYGPSNLVTDVLNAPDTVLQGDLHSLVDEIGADVNQIGHGVTGDTGLIDSVVDGNDPLNPVPEILDAISTTPLITAGDATGAGDGLIVGDLQNSGSGHLIDLEVGPAGAWGSGLPINVLATPSGEAPHTVELNVLDVGANGPALLDGSLLSGSSSFGGQDGLVGNALDPLDGGSAGTVITDGLFSAPLTVVEDVLDLGGGDLLGGGFSHNLLQDVA